MTDSEKIDLILTKMQGMEGQMQGMEGRMQGMEDRMQGMEDRMQGMEGRMQGMEGRMQGIADEVHSTKEKVNSIELTIENVTNRNIRIIAEGHFDLSRKLDDARKVENEKEMTLIRMNLVENEIRLIKEKISQTA